MWKLRFPRILLFTRGVTSPQPFVPTSGEMEIDVMGFLGFEFHRLSSLSFQPDVAREGRIPGRPRCFSLSFSAEK